MKLGTVNQGPLFYHPTMVWATGGRICVHEHFVSASPFIPMGQCFPIHSYGPALLHSFLWAKNMWEAWTTGEGQCVAKSCIQAITWERWNSVSSSSFPVQVRKHKVGDKKTTMHLQRKCQSVLGPICSRSCSCAPSYAVSSRNAKDARLLHVGRFCPQFRSDFTWWPVSGMVWTLSVPTFVKNGLSTAPTKFSFWSFPI